MKHFALEKIADKQAWFVIDFCQLGFIGKMFKSVELPWLVQFFLMFYNDKPGKKSGFEVDQILVRQILIYDRHPLVFELRNVLVC